MIREISGHHPHGGVFLMLETDEGVERVAKAAIECWGMHTKTWTHVMLKCGRQVYTNHSVEEIDAAMTNTELDAMKPGEIECELSVTVKCADCEALGRYFKPHDFAIDNLGDLLARHGWKQQYRPSTGLMHYCRNCTPSTDP